MTGPNGHGRRVVLAFRSFVRTIILRDNNSFPKGQAIVKRTSSARIEKQRKQEFLDQDVQFDVRWAEFLIEQTKNASLNPKHYWEGSANANCIIHVDESASGIQEDLGFVRLLEDDGLGRGPTRRRWRCLRYAAGGPPPAITPRTVPIARLHRQCSPYLAGIQHPLDVASPTLGPDVFALVEGQAGDRDGRRCVVAEVEHLPGAAESRLGEASDRSSLLGRCMAVPHGECDRGRYDGQSEQPNEGPFYTHFEPP